MSVRAFSAATPPTIEFPQSDGQPRAETGIHRDELMNASLTLEADLRKLRGEAR
jgi:hypothetical protein